MSRSSRRLLAAYVVAGVIAFLPVASNAGDPEEGRAASQQAGPPEATKLPFRTDRPRLLFTKDQIPTIRKRCEGPYAEDYKAMVAWADEQVKQVLSPAFEEKLQAIPKVEDRYARARQFRALVAPLETFGLLWHLTGKESYAKAGQRLVVACFESADSGEANLPVAYDLFYDALSPQERLDYGRKMIETVRSKEGYFEASFHGGRKTQMLIALYGTGIEEADVNARLAKAYDFDRRNYLVTYAQMARNRGGWNEGFFCACMGKPIHVPFWLGWQNATGEDIFGSNPLFYGMGNWVLYGLMDVSQPPAELGKFLVPVGSAPFSADAIRYQGVDLCAYLSRDSVGTWLAQRLYQTPAWQRILWKDPEVRPVEPQELPETALFEGWGWVSMRSSWASDGVFAHFICGPKGQGEPSHLDDASFIIYHKGLLAMDGVAPANHVGGVYGQMSLAHNTVTVLNPEGKVRGASTYTYTAEKSPFAVNDGGQTFWPDREGERRVRPDTVRDGYANTRGPSTLVWRGRITAYETGPLYDYVSADATNAYHSAAVKSFTRQFLFLKPDVFVVFDRVVSTNKDFRKRWHLQVHDEPVIEGDLVRAENAGGRLWCRVVLPEKAVIRKVQGAKLEGPDGNYESPAAWEKCGTSTWRVDLGPDQPREEDVFLNVLQAVDAGAPATFRAEAIRKGERIGVKVTRGERTFEVLFDAAGPAGGAVAVAEAGKVLARADLAAEVRDTYANWRDDPRFNAWMTDDRFRYLIPKQDRDRFRAGGANAGTRTEPEVAGSTR